MRYWGKCKPWCLTICRFFLLEKHRDLHKCGVCCVLESLVWLNHQARYKEVQGTTRGHFEYANFEQRVMEYLHYEPDAFKRHPKEKVYEALLVSVLTNCRQFRQIYTKYGI